MLKSSPKIAMLAAALMMGLCLAAAPASADMIKVHGITGKGVTINYKTFSNPLSTTAGQFNTTLNYDWDSPAFCVDIFQGAKMRKWYEADMRDPSERQGWLEAAWLMNEFSTGLGRNHLPDASFDPGSYSIRTGQAALQLAIWEAVYDDTHSTTGGDFTVTKAGSNVLNLTNAYLAALDNAGSVPGSLDSGFQVAYNAKYQDLLVSVPTSATPEPGTMILFGTAAGIMGYLRRRQVKRGKVALKLAEPKAQS